MTPTSSTTASNYSEPAIRAPVGVSPARLVKAHSAQLALLPAENLSGTENILLSAVHAGGLALVVRSIQTDWLTAIAVSSIAGLLLLILWRAFRAQPTWAVPFFLPYLVAADRFLLLRLAPGSVLDYYDYLPPDWSLLSHFVPGSLVASAVLSVVILLASRYSSRRLVLERLAAFFALVALTWAALSYFGGRTFGSAGTDPFAYVQMAVDLVDHGTPAHRFELFPLFVDRNLPWYPLVHAGYHLPMNRAGDAVSVWPPGGSVAFALAFALAGEPALYLVNPFFSLLSVVASGLLAFELLNRHARSARLAIAAGTMVLTATMNVQVVWAGVTMVDSQAAFWTLAAVWAVLRSRSASWFWPVLAGIAAGVAYDVRHTQLAVLLPVLIILAVSQASRRRALAASALALAAAFLIALPDLWYHRSYLGGWLQPESEELANYSLSAVGSTAAKLAQTLFAANEYGWLWPVLLIGLFLYARAHRVVFLALSVWLTAALAVHLPYTALRLRDLLPELPLLSFFAAYGTYELAARLALSDRMVYRASSGAILLLAVELSVLRGWYTVPSALEPERPIFGYMNQSQRQSFADLARRLPSDAVVGASLDSGPLELYGGARTFRPVDWNEDQREEFVSVMRAQKKPVFILEDSAEVDLAISDLAKKFTVSQVAVFDVPLFGDRAVPHPGVLWRIE